MDLKTYLSEQPRGTAAALAETIGAHRVLVSQWTADVDPRPVPVQHCHAIERATGGAVTRRDLRPDDWHRIWPELVTAEFPAPAPAEPAPQAVAQ